MLELKRIQDNYLKYFDKVFYITLFSIFLVDIKLYIPIFLINILLILTLIYSNEIKLKFSTYEIFAVGFMIWSVINTVISIFIFKNDISLSTVAKLNINIAYFISLSLVFRQKTVTFNKSEFLNLLEFIILINFIQIIVVYIHGDLFGQLIKGGLTKSSSTAYAVNAYHTIIGSENKNIWASKFTLIFITYLYTVIIGKLKISKLRACSYIALGLTTIILILSRTVQIAIIIPVIFIIFTWINRTDFKYKKAIYIFCGFMAVGVLFIFFNKLFHINFDTQDGGYSRLQMWISSLKEVWNTHWILGNGIGYSGYYIKTALNMFESNLHNVYLNIFFELGIIGITIYLAMIVSYFKSLINKESIWNIVFVIFIPFIIITMLQYLGFDNDIILMLLIIIAINKVKFKQV